MVDVISFAFAFGEGGYIIGNYHNIKLLNFINSFLGLEHFALVLDEEEDHVILLLRWFYLWMVTSISANVIATSMVLVTTVRSFI